MASNVIPFPLRAANDDSSPLPPAPSQALTVEDMDDGRILPDHVTDDLSAFDEALVQVRHIRREIRCNGKRDRIGQSVQQFMLRWWETELRRLFCEAQGNVVMFRRAA